MKFRSKILWLLLLLVGAACSAAPKGTPRPMMGFAHLQTLPVNVAEVNISEGREEMVQDFFITPHAALDSYLRARLKAAGHQNSLDATIGDATVTKRYVPSQQSVGRYFKVGGMDRYDVSLSLRLEHTDDQGRVIYGKVLNAKRVINISEHDSIAEREQSQLEAMESLFADLDRQVKRIVLEEMRL